MARVRLDRPGPSPIMTSRHRWARSRATRGGSRHTEELEPRRERGLLIAGHASDGGLDPGARLLDRLHVQPCPRDPTLTDTAHEHTDHVQRRPARLHSLPMPLAPDRVAIGHRAQELRAEVGNPIEHRRPVPSHLLAPSERSIGMRGLFARIVVLKASKKRLEVVRVHRRIQALHDNAWTVLSARGHDRSLDRRDSRLAVTARSRPGTSAADRTPKRRLATHGLLRASARVPSTQQKPHDDPDTLATGRTEPPSRVSARVAPGRPSRSSPGWPNRRASRHPRRGGARRPSRPGLPIRAFHDYRRPQTDARPEPDAGLRQPSRGESGVGAPRLDRRSAGWLPGCCFARRAEHRAARRRASAIRPTRGARAGCAGYYSPRRTVAASGHWGEMWDGGRTTVCRPSFPPREWMVRPAAGGRRAWGGLRIL